MCVGGGGKVFLAERTALQRPGGESTGPLRNGGKLVVPGYRA